MADGCSHRLFRQIVRQAVREGSGGRLVAAYRSWWGVGGPGLFTRLQLADDIDDLVKAAVERERMNERRARCTVADEKRKKPTRRGRHGSHDRKGKDHRRVRK